ncbi:MAG: cell division protein FtsH, partial [Chloroflexi bacterium]|nr:cell division protein FtsH [Chloroflexota bacterium]
IGMEEFEEAIERVVAGPERRSRLISEEEKRIIAYHEAGHALVRRMLPKADPVAKISIVARGMSLGQVRQLPERDFVLISRSKFEDEMAAILGGRAAEEIVFGDITDGATDDLEKATKIARAMVTQYGMSDRLGPLQFGQKDELVFLGREIAEQRNYSEQVAREIDREIQRFVESAYSRAREIILAYRAKLDEIAQRLLKEETIEREEFEAMFQDLPRQPASEPVPA